MQYGLSKQNEHDAGFTLIEVLVSFVILAAVTTATYQAFEDGLSAVARTNNAL